MSNVIDFVKAYTEKQNRTQEDNDEFYDKTFGDLIYVYSDLLMFLVDKGYVIEDDNVDTFDAAFALMHYGLMKGMDRGDAHPLAEALEASSIFVMERIDDVSEERETDFIGEMKNELVIDFDPDFEIEIEDPNKPKE